MYLSQFTIYSSADASHPVLSGTSGSLLALLNACLINGYGSEIGAGWTKTGSIGPATGIAIPDSGSCGIFVQPTGSKATLYLADNAQSIGAGRETRATGYDYIQNFTASSSPSSSTVAGNNPFPTAAQGILGVGLGYPSVPIRKSTSVDSTERQWIMFADSSGFYLFTFTGDMANSYQGFAFGDIYSFVSGSADVSKCIIISRNYERITVGGGTDEKLDTLSLVSTVVAGHFMQRSFSNVGGSITVGKHGDGAKGSTTLLVGITQCPNGPNNGLYISPVRVHENANAMIRGTMRGFWHLCHPTANFSDGQIITGTDDYAGRTFQVVKMSSYGGMYCIETSATVETN